MLATKYMSLFPIISSGEEKYRVEEGALLKTEYPNVDHAWINAVSYLEESEAFNYRYFPAKSR